MIRAFKGFVPRVHAEAYVAESAEVVGEVEIGPGASIWPHAVVRGDVGPIRIGARSNIQDGCVVHCTQGRFFATVGEDVTIGHSAIVHGCLIGDRVLIGMGAIVMDGAEVGADSIVGAGALVTPGTRIAPRSLAIGSPARVLRQLSDSEVAEIVRSAQHYVGYAREHRST